MTSWFNRSVDVFGSVYFRGSLPPRAEEFRTLAGQQIEVSPAAPPQAAHWALQLRHRDWGSAIIYAPRSGSAPLPKIILDYSPNLTPEERASIAAAGSEVVVKMKSTRGHILRDRKSELRFMRAVMGDDGLAALDLLAQQIWPPAALDLELVHDADLDIIQIIALHSVTSAPDGPVTWLHTHGLAEVGFFDFDVLRPSEDLLGRSLDAIRALAFGIVEGQLGRATPRFTLAQPGGDISTVEVAEFHRTAADEFTGLRDLDESHRDHRVVICDPAGGWLGRLKRTVRPARFLEREVDDGTVMRFSNEASDLMAERAHKSYATFRRLGEQLAEFELPLIAKLGYRVDGGGEDDLEHLWFQVEKFGERDLDATLLNTPHGIARMKAGQRGRHPVDVLTDWQILTPLGPINPRQTLAARLIRERRSELRDMLRAARATGGR